MQASFGKNEALNWINYQFFGQYLHQKRDNSLRIFYVLVMKHLNIVFVKLLA